MPTTIVMPQLGESVAEGVIGKWLKHEGDRVEKDEPFVEIITDKVNAEIPSPVAGVLVRLTQAEGATVAVGQEIAVIGEAGEQDAAAANDGQQAAASSPPLPMGGDGADSAGSAASAVATAERTGNQRGERVRSSPLVRRLAEEHGVDVSQVPGTGIAGRVSKQDILAFIEAQQRAPVPQPAAAAIEVAPPPTATPAAPSGPAPAPVITPAAAAAATAPRPLIEGEELVPITPLRRMIAERMVQSVYTIPHATTTAECDMTNVVRFREAKKDEFRQREGIPLSYVAFVVKAAVEALKEYPLVNAEWTEAGIIMKRQININVAVDSPEGLTTPVIHHADERSLAGLSRAIYDLASRAREKKLRIEDMQGGTFTVNNTGALGSVSGVSIINYPQAGILSAAAIVKRPVVIEQDGQDLMAIRHMMNLPFTFDHRLLDGGYAAAFVNAVKAKLERWPMAYPLY